jgi:hypothetical protein
VVVSGLAKPPKTEDLKTQEVRSGEEGEVRVEEVGADEFFAESFDH